MSGENKGRHKGRVLIVEDSVTQAMQLGSILELHGYEVTVAENGLKGFETFCSSRFDLVLSDVVMPELSGYELCRKIKSHSGGAAVPVVLITQLNELKDLVEGLLSGADSFITKPFEPEYLLGRISCMLEEHRENKDLPHPLAAINKLAMLEVDRLRILNYLVATFEDFLRVRQIEYKRQLDEAERKIELVGLREEFMTRLSHDLKNPLLGTEMIHKTLLSGRAGELKPEQRKLVTVLRTSNIALLDMVLNMVDAYRFESGCRMIFDSVDVVALVESCIEEIEELARDRGLTIDRTYENKLVEAEADRIALRRLVTNLLGNSVRYTPAGGKVSVSVSADTERLTLAVCDTGPGIPEDQMEHLFEPFRPGSKDETTTRFGGGSGLGLFICRQIAEAHDGDISCASRSGSGTTFTLTMPLIQTRRVRENVKEPG